MSKILFSPLGMTDPITHLFDGSMLHICRVYKPDIVILYMSAEVIAFHEKDNRYVYCINKLSECIEHPIEVHIVKRPELLEVQEYDVFYDDFYNIMESLLKNTSKEDRILLNVASGTPAMKSALLVMSVLADNRLHPIQVATPIRKSNMRLEDKIDYDVESNWELNEDNEPDFINRCTEPKTRNFSVLLMKDNIRKLIMAYDYEAALVMASEIEEFIPRTAMNLIRIGCERLKLNKSGVDILRNQVPYDVIPVKAGDQRMVFEYTLSLDIKRKKGEYADFVRALTPLVADLVETILLKKCNIDIEDYITVSKKGVPTFSPSKLKGTKVLEILTKEFGGSFLTGMVGTRQMVPIIIELSNDAVLKRNVGDIMKVEQKVRNLTAHEIVSVTPEWIQKKSGFTLDKIFKIIKYLVCETGINVSYNAWDSYDIMNQYIIEELI